jgi:predicted TPR repeat methyltransferase
VSRDPLACPDPLAARRYAFGQAAAAIGDWTAAEDLFRQTLELAPAWAPAWFAIADVREKRRDRAGAAEFYRAALAADPGDALGAGPRLALLERRQIAALPAPYVARLFDDYAPRFDRHLTEKLGYRGPEVILAALDEAAPGRRFSLGLDLGCGSGLMGRALRARVGRLVGVDLSERMVAKAREAGVYDELSVGDLVAFLHGRTAGEADLAVAADALVYLGDLRSVCAAAAAALAQGGLFVFTLERGEAPFALGWSLRFQHSEEHVREAVAGAGLRLVALKTAATRTEGGADAPGWLAAAARD